MRFTDISLSRLTHDGTQRAFFDDALPNFGIRVGKRRKTWFILLGTARKRISLGRYPRMPLKEARTKAIQLLEDDSPLAPTLREVIDRYARDHLTVNTRESTARVFLRHLNRHFEHLHDTPLNHITARDIAAIFPSMKATPSEANQAFTAVKALFSWAASQHFLDHHPLAHLKMPYKKVTRDRTLSDEELKKLFQATADSSQHAIIVRLLLYTAQRPNEIARLEWTWIDEANRTITIPKAVAKNNTEHTFPYGDLVAEALTTINRTSRLVFPSSTGTSPFTNWTRDKSALGGCGIDAHWQHRDLRRTAATNLARTGAPPNIVERILNHKQPKLAATYNRWHYIDEMRAVLPAYEQFLRSLIG